MNAIKIVIILSIMAIGIDSYSQTYKTKFIGRDTLEVTLLSIGKSGFLYEFSDIPKEYVTTVLWVSTPSEAHKAIIVNDQAFNYPYFQKEILPTIKGERVSLHVNLYRHDNDTIYVATRIK